MSYIQINIGGKLRGWKTNQLTIELFSKHISVSAVDTTSIYAAMYAGLVSNCYVKSEEPDFTFEDVCNWVDEIYASKDLKTIEAVNDCFKESSAYIQVMETIQEKLRIDLKQPDKKKVKKK